MLVDTTVWVDVHLLVSAEAAGEKLLTRDRRLKAAAETLGLA
jgi:predicted nucleic acid-binding protein